MYFFNKISFINNAPKPSGLYFQDSASPQMEALIELHDNIMFYLAIILFGVAWIMASIIRNFVFNKSPISNKYLNHGTLIELIWTVTPALILILIAFPSFKLLYLMDEVTDPSLTIFVEGHQWYWSYQYPDFFSEESNVYTDPLSSTESAVNNLLGAMDPIVYPVEDHVEKPIEKPINLASFYHEDKLHLYDSSDNEGRRLKTLLLDDTTVHSITFTDPYNVTKKVTYISPSKSKYDYHWFKFSHRFDQLKNNGDIRSIDPRINGGLRTMGNNVLKVFAGKI